MDTEDFPKIDLFPRLSQVGHFVASLVRHLPESGFPSSRGGGPMLDRELNPGEIGGVATNLTLFE